MGRIIAISNHKGGVGKTTSTLNIGAGLSKLGKKVLMIDLDPQSNLTQSCGISEVAKSVYGAIRGQYQLPLVDIADRLELSPSELNLTGAEIELSSETGREYIIKELIDPIKDKYDYVLIDCPPSLGLLTINAFAAVQEVFIPLQAEYLALQGLSKLLEIIDKVQKRINKDLKVGGVIITQFDSRRILNRDVVSAITAHFKDKVFATKIRDNVALAEAPTKGLDIFRYNPKSLGAEDYMGLCKEIIELPHK